MKNSCIVVIDDEPRWSERFKDILNDQGYSLVDVINKLEKFSSLLKGYDLAIIDIKMPRYDGFQLKDYFRNRSPATRVLLTSQHEDFGLGLLDKAKGADAWIEKKELDGNEIRFIMLVEDLLKKDSGQACGKDLLERIVINNINEVNIRTADQVELKSLLNQVKRDIRESSIAKKDDATLDVEQIGLELSKKKKNKNYILGKIEEINKGFGHVASIGNSTGRIAELIKDLLT